MLHALIMAGGSGTRFWPASRQATPKQLLALTGSQSMLQNTVSRLQGLVPNDHVLIMTNERLLEPIAQQLPALKPESLVGEPCRRDTAPCIGFAAARFFRADPEAVMAVMPADHVINPPEVFREAIKWGEQLVNQQPTRLVTFGIRPTYPAESFGYIERGQPITLDRETGPPTFRVERFREKPDATTAQQFLDSGQFYWNSGIFVWRAKTILDQLAEHEPDMHAHLMTISEAFETDNFHDVFRSEFAEIDGRSIDFAVMEHAQDVAVVEAPFDWDDVGSWQALGRLGTPDANNNTITGSGRTINIDSRGCIIRAGDDHLLVTLGLEDCIVVHTPDATLVAHKSREESVRDVVRQLGEREWSEYL